MHNSACAQLRFLAARLRILTPLILAPAFALAGGPKYVAGTSFFNPAVVGQTIHWSGGQVSYFVDQGPLSAIVSNQQATAMVDAAAALWSAVPTAAVTVTRAGFLNEDVDGSNIVAANGQIAQPADVTESAINYPVGFIFDADGSVIDSIFGLGASQPTSCQFNGVWAWIDAVNPDATIAHAVILLNGRCATTPDLVAMMSYQLERAFGRILNLDFSQIDPISLNAQFPASDPDGPIMQALSGACNELGDLPIFYAAAIISAGVSYNSGTGDALTLDTAPANMVAIGVPVAFTVTALSAPISSLTGTTLAPAAGVTVEYAVTSGSALLACGLSTCSVSTSGDGVATIDVTAVNRLWSTVTASLTNGSTLQSEFVGGTPPVLANITPALSLAAGAMFTWTVQAIVLNNGQPIAGQSIAWQTSAAGFSGLSSTPAITDSTGLAARQLTVGPLAEGQTASIYACLNGTGQCVTYTAFGAHPEYASLAPVSGTIQTLSAQQNPSPITLRVLDVDGNPVAGASVSLYQALYAWTPPCSVHAVCPPSNLLAVQTASAPSALDGTVSFAVATLPGVATTLRALAASGNSSAVIIPVEQHP